MVIGFFAAKKFFPQYFTKGESLNALRIIETLPMGDRRSIALIQFANSRFLVGSTPHQINLLTTLRDQVSLVSEPDNSAAPSKRDTKRETKSAFRNLFEVERNRSPKSNDSPLPEEVRNKMRRLREALER
jgi:flagellar biogenesis protein FliO